MLNSMIMSSSCRAKFVMTKPDFLSLFFLEEVFSFSVIARLFLSTVVSPLILREDERTL